ncbi:hypothetical protein [Protofrankia coriariae]|uniref:hypothetical protein n=1 Tax=Protofrankia coriariae TaxID=1562887 RepID=UPI0012F6685A|nr:hypothetical protein [Protofrankia coriariae]
MSPPTEGTLAGLSGDAGVASAAAVSVEVSESPGGAGAFKGFGTVGSAEIFEGDFEGDEAADGAEARGGTGASEGSGASAGSRVVAGAGEPAVGLPAAPSFLPTGTVSLLGVTPPPSPPGASGAVSLVGAFGAVPPPGVSGEPLALVDGASSAGWSAAGRSPAGCSAGCPSAGWLSRGAEPVSRVVGGVAAGMSALSSGWTATVLSKIPTSDVHTGLRMEAGNVFSGPNSGSSAGGTHGSTGSTASTASPEAPGGCSGFSSIPRRLRCPTDLRNVG